MPPIILDGTTGITTPGLTNTGTETILNLTTTGNTILGDATTDTLNVGAGGLVKDASGNVGIGTSSPSYKLDVTGSAGVGIRYKSSGSYGGFLADNTSGTGGGFYSAYQNGSQKAIFGVSGSFEGNTSSDAMIASDATGGAIRFYTNGSTSEKMRLDSSGNLGLGVTPNTWNIGKAIQLGTLGALWSQSYVTYVLANAYYNAGYKYVGTGAVSIYEAGGGSHVWYSAGSGTAGNAISLTQAMTLDASGNLSVGATAPVSTEKAYIYQSGTGRVLIARSDNGSFADNCIQASVNRNTSNNTFNAFAYYNDAAAAYRFKVADSGAIATAGGIALGTATAPTSGIGVQFPATQSASSDANTLDDYEEGTWTPTLTGTSGVASYTTQSGSYVKIGNTVFCNFFIQFAKNTLSGNITLGGLPFQVGSATYNACVPAANWYFPSGGPAIVSFHMRTGTNTSTATFYYLTSGNLDATANILTDAQIGSTSSQQITCMFYYNV